MRAGSLGKLILIGAVLLALCGVVLVKAGRSSGGAEAGPPAPGRPRLLDLGATYCQPCKMMVPVLDSLRQEYAGKLSVEFINVDQNAAAAEKYRIQSIPTQILFDASGKEVFRHLGFWPQEEIVAKCRELGFGL